MNCLNGLLVEGRVEAGIRMGACNVANVRVWVLLLSLGAPSVSLSLPLGKGLRQEL